MFEFIGKLFGSNKALDTVVEGASNAIDKLVYTEEEKADAAAAERSEARKMVVAWMASTQGQNLSRRLLALAISSVWLMQYVLAQIVSVIAIWSVEPARWNSTGKLMQSGAEAMNGAVMLILAFYFAAPHMGAIVEKVLGNMKERGVIPKG